MDRGDGLAARSVGEDPALWRHSAVLAAVGVAIGVEPGPMLCALKSGLCSIVRRSGLATPLASTAPARRAAAR